LLQTAAGTHFYTKQLGLSATAESTLKRQLHYIISYVTVLYTSTFSAVTIYT